MASVFLERDDDACCWHVISGTLQYTSSGELEWREQRETFADADFCGGKEEARAHAIFYLGNERRAAANETVRCNQDCDQCLQRVCRCDELSVRAILSL